jgi:Macrocin-O-methyltransferase (TylF)
LGGTFCEMCQCMPCNNNIHMLSCADVLFNVYDRVPMGGYVIVDDWTIPECQKAIKHFWKMHGGEEEVTWIDSAAVWWQKTHAAPLQHEWYQKFNASRGSET